jgi:hypothetical protein
MITKEWLSRYCHWLLAGRRRDRSSSPGNIKNSWVVQTESGAHPISCTVVSRNSPRVKLPGREADHLSPKPKSIHTLPHTPSWSSA